MSNPLWSNIAARPASSNANTHEAIASRARAKAQANAQANAQAKANSQVKMNEPIHNTKQTELVRFNTIFPGGPNNNTKAWLNKRRKTKKIHSSSNTILRTIQNRSRQNPYKNNPNNNNSYFPTIQYIEDTTLADPNNPTGTYYIERNTNNEKIRSRIQTATESSKESSSYTVTTIDGNYDHNANAMKVALTNIEAINKKIVPFEIDPENDEILLDIGSLIALTPEDIKKFSSVDVTNVTISRTDRQKIKSFNKVNLLVHGELCIVFGCELIKITLTQLDEKIKILEKELQKIYANHSNVKTAEIISKIKGDIGTLNMMKTNYEHLLQYIIKQPPPEQPSDKDCMIWFNEKKTHGDVFIRNNKEESERAPTYNHQEDIVEKKLNEVEKNASAAVNNQDNLSKVAIRGKLPLPLPSVNENDVFFGNRLGPSNEVKWMLDGANLYNHAVSAVDEIVIFPEEKDQIQKVYDGLTEDTQAAISKLPPKVFYYTLQNYLSNAYVIVGNHLKGGATPLSSKYKRTMKGGFVPVVIAAYAQLVGIIGIGAPAAAAAVATASVAALSLMPITNAATVTVTPLISTQADVSFPETEIDDTIKNIINDFTTAKQRETEVMHESVQEAVKQVHEEILSPVKPSVQTHLPEKDLQAVTAKRISEAKAVETAAANTLTALENSALETSEQLWITKNAISSSLDERFTMARNKWIAKGKPNAEKKAIQELRVQAVDAQSEKGAAFANYKTLVEKVDADVKARVASAAEANIKRRTNAAEDLQKAQALTQKAKKDASDLALQMQEAKNAADKALNQTRIQLTAQKAEAERLALIAAEKAEANRVAAVEAAKKQLVNNETQRLIKARANAEAARVAKETAEANRVAAVEAAKKQLANNETQRLIKARANAEAARVAKETAEREAEEAAKQSKIQANAAAKVAQEPEEKVIFHNQAQFRENIQAATERKIKRNEALTKYKRGQNMESNMGNANTAYFAFMQNQASFATAYGKETYDKLIELEGFLPDQLKKVWKGYMSEHNNFLMELRSKHSQLYEIIQLQSVLNIANAVIRKEGMVTTSGTTIVNPKSSIELHRREEVNQFINQVTDQTVDDVKLNIIHKSSAGTFWSTVDKDTIKRVEITGKINEKQYHVYIKPDEIDSFLQPFLVRFIWPSELLPSVKLISTQISNLNNLPVSLSGFYRKYGAFASMNIDKLKIQESIVFKQILAYNELAVNMFTRTLAQTQFNSLTTIKKTNPSSAIKNAAHKIQQFMMNQLEQYSLISGTNVLKKTENQFEQLGKALHYLDLKTLTEEQAAKSWEDHKDKLMEALHKVIKTGTTVVGAAADIAVESSLLLETIAKITKILRESVSTAAPDIIDQLMKLLKNIFRFELITIVAVLVSCDLYNNAESAGFWKGLGNILTLVPNTITGVAYHASMAAASNILFTSIIPVESGLPINGNILSYGAGPAILYLIKKGLFCKSQRGNAIQTRRAAGVAAAVISSAAPPHGQAGSACERLVPRTDGGFHTARKHHKRSHRTYKRHHKKAHHTRKRHYKNRRHTR